MDSSEILQWNETMHSAATPRREPATLLALHRADPASVREAIERGARRERNKAIFAFFVRLFV